MKIALTKGRYALIDKTDHLIILKHKWHFTPSKWGEGYAVTRIEGKTIYLHRFILGLSKGQFVDHVNHNGLDNRRCNLRVCTQHDNNGNSSRPVHNTSGYKGVSFYKGHKTKPWTAYITNMRKKIHLGYFKTAREAALAYNERALEQWGEFALLNKITS